MNNVNQRTTELPEDFFDQQEVETEEIFKTEFQNPMNPKAMDEVIDNKEDQEREDIEDEQIDFEKIAEQKDLEQLQELNEKFDTNFKSMKEFRESIKKKEQEPVLNEISQKERDLRVFETFLDPEQYPDDKLVLEQELLNAERNPKINHNDPDVIEEIKDKVRQMEENNVLSYAAQSIRSSLRGNYNILKGDVEKMKNSIQQTQQEKEQNFKETLQESIGSIFKEGEFAGVKIKKEDLYDVYSKVMKNKDSEHVSQNPAEAVEFELFKRYKGVILKNASKPDFKDGVRSALEEVGVSNTNSKSKDERQFKTDSGEDEDWISAFVK